MNKKILLVDAYTPAHVGNGVLLKSSINVIRRAFPNADVRFLSLEMTTPKLVTDLPYDEFPFRFPIHLSKVRKILWLAINALFMIFHVLNRLTFKLKPSTLMFAQYRRTAFEIIEDADIVISITGEAINDRTRTTLPFFMFTYWMAASLGKKMVIFPQSIGPLNRTWTRMLSKVVLSKCALVVGRDDISMTELESIGLPKEICCFSPDVGVIQPYIETEEAKLVLRRQLVDVEKTNKLLIGISVSKPKEDGIANIDHITVLINAINLAFNPEDVRFLILPANMPLPGVDEGDLADCQDLAKRLPQFDVEIMEPRIYSPEEYKGTLSLLDLFITSRMHVAILATMAATPTITLNTQRKLYGFMNNIGQSEYSLNLDRLTVDGLISVIEKSVESLPQISNELASSAKVMEEKIVDFSRKLVERLG